MTDTAQGTETQATSPDPSAPEGVGEETLGDPVFGEDMPPAPDHIREAAQQAPDHWFGMIDPTWSGDSVPPHWAMVGQWRSDLGGEIVEWRDNKAYRPSPTAMNWPEPTDPVDAAVQLAATGYGPAEGVTQALAEAEVAVFQAADGDPLCAVAPDDETLIVPVFTSPDQLHAAGRLSFRTMTAAELLEELPEEHVIYLNSAGAVSMTVEPDMLREAVEDGDVEGGGTGDLGAGDGVGTIGGNPWL
jgi:SseB protein N-terminal domain